MSLEALLDTCDKSLERNGDIFTCELSPNTYIGVLKVGNREMKVYTSTVTGHALIDGSKKHIITLIEI